MPINLKNYVPSEVRLEQARHKARKAYGRGRIVVSNGTSEAYRSGWDRIWRAMPGTAEGYGASEVAEAELTAQPRDTDG